MASIFSKIIAGDIPSYKIAENNYCYAFLDINPLVKGHTLVVPKLEVDYLFDLPKENYLQLFEFSQKIAKAIKKTIPCKRIGMTVLGLEVPHAHIHLIPINNGLEIDFTKPKLKLNPNEFIDIAQKIFENID